MSSAAQSQGFVCPRIITMDAAKKKALYRGKLAQKQERRVESPLVRYNEHDQPVCRVCEVVLKSESNWLAHQASRNHHKAISNVKSNAAALSQSSNVHSVPTKLPKSKPEHSDELHNNKPEPSVKAPNSRPSAMPPPDFFDRPETKKQKTDSNSQKKAHDSTQSQVMEPINHVTKRDESTINSVEGKPNAILPVRESAQPPKMVVGSGTKQLKGALPEGFFDDKDADLRARGITPVKPDIKDEYKEYEKAIKEDLQEVDNRLEEEEYDAAEMIVEAESVEQRTYRERVEMLKKKKEELKAVKSGMQSRVPQVLRKDSSDEEASSGDESDETVDWRAKQF